jgi:ligand-binding sensor protein
MVGAMREQVRAQNYKGLAELAVPITVQGRPVSALLCGEFFRRKPTEQGFEGCRRRRRHLEILLERGRAVMEAVSFG